MRYFYDPYFNLANYNYRSNEEQSAIRSALPIFYKLDNNISDSPTSYPVKEFAKFIDIFNNIYTLFSSFTQLPESDCLYYSLLHDCLMYSFIESKRYLTEGDAINVSKTAIYAYDKGFMELFNLSLITYDVNTGDFLHSNTTHDTTHAAPLKINKASLKKFTLGKVNSVDRSLRKKANTLLSENSSPYIQLILGMYDNKEIPLSFSIGDIDTNYTIINNFTKFNSALIKFSRQNSNENITNLYKEHSCLQKVFKTIDKNATESIYRNMDSISHNFTIEKLFQIYHTQDLLKKYRDLSTYFQGDTLEDIETLLLTTIELPNAFSKSFVLNYIFSTLYQYKDNDSASKESIEELSKTLDYLCKIVYPVMERMTFHRLISQNKPLKPSLYTGKNIFLFTLNTSLADAFNTTPDLFSSFFLNNLNINQNHKCYNMDDEARSNFINKNTILDHINSFIRTEDLSNDDICFLGKVYSKLFCLNKVYEKGPLNMVTANVLYHYPHNYRCPITTSYLYNSSSNTSDEYYKKITNDFMNFYTKKQNNDTEEK